MSIALADIRPIVIAFACACTTAAQPAPAPRPAISAEEQAWLHAAPIPPHGADPNSDPRPGVGAFAERFLRAVHEHWQLEANAEAPPEGAIVALTLTSLGDIRDITIGRSSGAASWDARLIEAIRASAPFTHPPAALSNDGVVSLNVAFAPSGEGRLLGGSGAYFRRMKAVVQAAWDPVSAYSRHGHADAVANDERTTVLRVTLNADGTLKAITVAKSSGFAYLDDEAVEAFERAAPFPNPPRGLVLDGVLVFEFGLTLQFRSGQATAGSNDVQNATNAAPPTVH